MRFLKKIPSWALYMSIMVCVFLFHHYVAYGAYIPSASMYPTIENPAYVVVNHLSTEYRPVHRGEIIVFKYPDNPKKVYIKRVIGLPGDIVSIHDGSVWVNGEKIYEPYLQVTTEGQFGPYKVPDKKYFVMGDNRNNSNDSRYWKQPFVDQDQILGQAIFQIYPHVKRF